MKQSENCTRCKHFAHEIFTEPTTLAEDAMGIRHLPKYDFGCELHYYWGVIYEPEIRTCRDFERKGKLKLHIKRPKI